MEELIKSLETMKKLTLDDLNSGKFKHSEAHLKGMIAGLEAAIKAAMYEMEVA